MKILIILSLSATAALGCSNLPKLAACNIAPQGGGDCGCQAGFSCSLTKNMIYNGQVIPVKQCMLEGMDIEVEEVDLDNQSADEPMTKKRFLFNRCSSKAECQDNYCCALGKRCAPKLGEFYACFFVNKHNCGCGNGLQSNSHDPFAFWDQDSHQTVCEARVDIRQS